MRVLTSEGSRKADSYMTKDIGIPSIILMENAATEIFNFIKDKGESFSIFCGVGNNGGDGLATGRKLINYGRKVNFYIVGDLKKASEEFKVNYNILLNLGNRFTHIISSEDVGEVYKEIEKSDILIDSIFGVGLCRDIQGIFKDLIILINESKRKVISIDCPSGLSATTGEVLGECIIANETLAIGTMKRGFLKYSALEYLGKVTVLDIGISTEAVDSTGEEVYILDKKDYRNILPTRKIYGHKGDYGKVLILAGSVGLSGAAYLTARGASKVGSGLVNLLVPVDIQGILASKLIEEMTINYGEKDKIMKLLPKISVLICGPGLGDNKEAREILKYLLSETTCPIVLDADGINIISKDSDLIKKIKNRSVITPHPGEMARLVNKTVEYVECNREEISKNFARDYNTIVLLKGFYTVITDGDRITINTSGNSKMSSGGMGDLLSGIIGGLISQGIGVYDSSILGAYIHGKCGEVASKGKYSVSASELIDYIPEILERIRINNPKF